MIQASNVGVGIQRKEGSQAALAADFVIHRFRHLERLPLLHGRYNNYRTSLVIVLSFYKNLCFIFPVALFAFWDQASSQQIYEGMLMSVYNAFWAALPPLFIGALEKDIPEEACLEHPKAFQQSVDYPFFNLRMFIVWMAYAMVQGAIIYFPVFIITHENMGIWHHNAKGGDLMSFGNIIYAYVNIVVNARMVMECREYNWPILISGFIGPSLFLLASYIWSLPGSYDWGNTLIYNYLGTVEYTLSSPMFFIAMPVVVFLCLFPTIIYYWIERESRASLRDILYEAYRKGYDRVGNEKLTTRQIVEEYKRKSTMQSSLI